MTEQTIRGIADLFIESHPVIANIPAERIKQLETRKREDFENILRWLLERFVIIGREKMERVVGQLNGQYDNGNDELVGVYLGELTRLVEESDE